MNVSNCSTGFSLHHLPSAQTTKSSRPLGFIHDQRLPQSPLYAGPPCGPRNDLAPLGISQAAPDWLSSFALFLTEKNLEASRASFDDAAGSASFFPPGRPHDPSLAPRLKCRLSTPQDLLRGSD
ncbi:uncharacterized protein N7459_000700 [Penicillium hispanicum]|uniref:uncharacterized protein n=1 Tax=Penicillium hispanicum TaxID=1080232 RepID=UPI00254056EA|nr:uncharacterized protein N7459_000700 [Penicillium hispanicum]KAJ5594492.1 hypothetical protein N7459_000700 [Penicillium hispanicum]